MENKRLINEINGKNALDVYRQYKNEIKKEEFL